MQFIIEFLADKFNISQARLMYKTLLHIYRR